MDVVRPQCCTEHLLELIGFTSDLLSRYEILHWLDYGTLLGAVREGELIPWDGDADLGMLKRQEGSVLALADEVRAAGHCLFAVDQGTIRVTYSEANRRFLDLFIWEQRDGMLLPLEDTDYAWPGMASRLAFPERFISPLGEVSLHERAFPAPEPVEEFLSEHRYGPDYATPAPPIRSVKLYPSFDLGECTHELEQLIARLGEGDRRLGQLTRESRLSDYRVVQLWQKTGLPVCPQAARVTELLAELGAGHRTGAVEDLVRSIALVEQAVEELERRPASRSLRRTWRRLRRALELVLSRIQHRPHRAGFPFGSTAAGGPRS